MRPGRKGDIMKLIPAINGTYEKTENRFRLPYRFGISGEYPEVNAVFAHRLGKMDDYRMAEHLAPSIVYRESPLPDEAYALEIGQEQVVISAKGKAGYANGLTTLYQMIVGAASQSIPCGTLRDAPKYAVRGLMLDVCRHFFTVDEVKKIIEQAALLKINRFHWHLSEDQGYRIESTVFPKLNEISSWRALHPLDPMVSAGLAQKGERYGGYYTKEEIREVVAFAAARNMEVVPEIDLPGHSSAVLAAFNALTCSGEPLEVKNRFGIHERIYCAGNEKVFDFLQALLDEVCELFPSPYFHIGGDEAPKSIWKTCPACNHVMAQEGLKSYEALQSYFMNRVIAHLKTKGKTAIVWNESVAPHTLDDSAIVQYWFEMHPGESYMPPEVAAGRKFIMSSMNQLYCDNSYADLPLKATYLYNPQMRDCPVPEDSVLGIEAAVWTEWNARNEDIEKQLYPRLLAVAECAWSRVRDFDDFLCRAKEWLQNAQLSLLEPTPWAEATISGERALQAILDKILGQMRVPRSREGKPDEEDSIMTLPDDMDYSGMAEHFMRDKYKASYADEEIAWLTERLLSAGRGREGD